MPKRRVDYIRDRIARRAGQRQQGSTKSGVTVEDDRMAVALGKGSGGGGDGRTPSVGKELSGGRSEEEEEEGDDFLAELRAAFRSNENEELASVDDLATLSSVAAREEQGKEGGCSSSDIDRSLVVPEEESGSIESGNPVEAFGDILAEGPRVLERNSSAMRRPGGVDSGEDEQGNVNVLSLEDVKEMKVCGAVMVHVSFLLHPLLDSIGVSKEGSGFFVCVCDRSFYPRNS